MTTHDSDSALSPDAAPSPEGGTLFLEPFGGLAGDMLLAALLDLGDPRVQLDGLVRLAEALVPGEARLSTREVQRGGLRALHLEVATPESEHAPHRHLSDLVALVQPLPLKASVRARVESCLRRLAEAEARAHGIPVEKVHFHEVGAVDTLIDVCGAFWALDELGVTEVRATPPLVGSGTVRCAHGEMPVPAPGTAELLRDLPGVPGGGGERLTPTGAAILAELAPTFEAVGATHGESATFSAQAIGYGAGTRDPREGPPNLVRVRLGRSAALRGGAPMQGGAMRRGSVWLCEFNLDDATGEEIGFCLDELRAAGALETWTHAVQMKKGRPGVVVSALARPDQRDAIENTAFAHTTTLGVRWRSYERTECAREHVQVELDGRVLRAVLRVRPEGEAARRTDLSPEYDDLAAMARETGHSLRELEEAARSAWFDNA